MGVNLQMLRPYKIGTVATAAGVNVQTLRYYEQVGLIAKPSRTEGGFRLYAPETIRRVRFIKKAQALGFSLEEVRELLALDESPETTCRDVRDRVDAKVASIDAMLRQLKQLRRALVDLGGRCPSDASSKRACPLLSSLIGEE